MLFFRCKSNGARLTRLIKNVAIETTRRYFDSKCPPSKLKAILNDKRVLLDHLHSKRVIRDEQMKVLFPPAGMPPKTSEDYDIILLFILIRNICELAPPATGWNEEPRPTDNSIGADFVRIMNYTNEVYNHSESLEVNDHEFAVCWKEITGALVSLGANDKDIEKLTTSSTGADVLNMLLEYSLEYKPNAVKLLENIARSITDKQMLFILGFILAVLVFLPFLQPISSPDYSYSQNFSNPSFVGREWVFRQMENILNKTDSPGILLVAEPGWGKTTLMRHLISSSSSSAFIHDNIIGHHICKFIDKSTRDGGRFVKNLVHLIGNKIHEYKRIISSNQLIKDVLKSNCNDNPVECFNTAIVKPLQNLDSTGRPNSFILIDALDECMEKEESHLSVIVNIIGEKVPDLPNWVKLIVTSRNHPVATIEMVRTVELYNLTINVNDKNNQQDLHMYANRTFQSFMNKTSSNEEILRMQRLIVHAVRFCKGNFLFLETILKNWKKYPDKINADSISESLEHIYAKSFARRFTEDNLVRFQPFLEILLAADSPLTFIELEKILNYHFHENFSARKVANLLSEYFKADINQGPLEFHHQFFAKWLINQTEGKAGIVVKKSRGHRYIFDYLLNVYEERQSKLTFEELSELCAHFLHGKETTQSNVRRLSSLKVSEIRDNRKKCILHHLASKRDATKLVTEFVKQFNSVDILDDDGWTPAMYAVEAGNYENVKLFIDNKANLDYVVEYKEYLVSFLLMQLDDYFAFQASMIYIAAHKGYFDIINLLIERGANIEIADQNGRKPLHLIATVGKFEIAEVFINKGAQLDVLSLHHAAARNHTGIVRLFLDAGVRDECLSCKSGNRSWCSTNINRFHIRMCETALYAAVSRNNLEMAKLILQYGTASVNCRHGSGRTALMEAFSQKNSRMVELLINAGADINAECKRPLTQLMYDCYDDYDSLYIRYCKQPVCDGNRVIDFSFAYGLWKVMTPFISKEKHNTSSDNARRNLATVAVIYDRVDVINATYGYSMESIPNIETVLRYAVVCHSVKTLEHLLYSEDVSKFTTVYEDGKTLLHLAILGSVKSQTKVYKTQSCPSSWCICPKITHADIVEEKRLETVKLLIKVLISYINKQDKYGRTALHYATVQVLPEIVKCLISKEADWGVRDQRGDTALEYALRERPCSGTEIFLPCRWTSDHVLEVCQSTVFDELVSYQLKNQTITECDGRAKTLLNGLLYHRLPLSLYSLFKSGLDVNCAREHFIRYLNQTVFNDGRRERDDLLIIFEIFRINMQVLCGVPFRQSMLHLMSYMIKQSLVNENHFKPQVGNLLNTSANKNVSSLQRFISNHPKGVEILNECYDKEGYLPIHRAVQGGNAFALSLFIKIGADITKKTKSGLTILVLAVRWLPDHLYISAEIRQDYNFKIVKITENENLIRASSISKFQTDYILETIIKIAEKKNLTHAFFQCNSDISPLHVAASIPVYRRELRKNIATLSPELSLTCANIDGIQPIYLAYLYHYNHPLFRESLVELGMSPENERLFKYPEREVEYRLIYNYFYHTPKHDLKNELNDDSLFACPGINDLLLNKTEIEEHFKLLSRHCWPSAFEASRKFSSNFPDFDIQNNISNTDKFMDIASHMAELRFHLVKTFPFFSMSLKKNVWRKVTNAHCCAFRCSCFEIMKLLQEKFTSEPLGWWDSISSDRLNVGSFLFERMGWTNTSSFGDVRYRWPFRFLLKKALKKDKAYNYLQILNPKREFGPRSDI